MDNISILLWIGVFLLGIYLFPFRESFVVKTPNWLGGHELFSWTPHTCPVDRPDLESGLCYEKCRQGYHGVGPVCWADSENVGAGTAVSLEDCPPGWINDGLTCREPISCKSVSDCFSGRGCGCSGGNVRGRLNDGGKCPGPGGNEYTDRVDGLCYKKCPAHLPNRIPGMPYLCYTGGPLSYTRGIGKVPSMIRVIGKYPFL